MTETNSAKSDLARIRAIALDVDGVLTDGGLWWGPGGEEWKRFCFADIMGVSLARTRRTGIGADLRRRQPACRPLCPKMHIRHVVKGCRDKAAALREFAAAAGIDLAEICFMGDDVNDLPAMQIAGSLRRPGQRCPERSGAGEFLANSAGGNGAVRELIEALLAARGLDYARSLHRVLESQQQSLKSATVELMKLSDYVVRFIAEQGVKHVFLVTGGGAMHLNNSLADEKRLMPVCNSHEQASAICAEGYAKATNHLGVCMVTTGPGGTNAVTGVAGAWLDSTPTLFISGQVKRPDRMFDKRRAARWACASLACRKWTLFPSSSRLRNTRLRFSIPMTSATTWRRPFTSPSMAAPVRCGSTFLSTFRPLQFMILQSLRAFDPAELETQAAASNLPTEVGQLIAKLNQAERPLLFAGNGIRLAHAENGV